MKLDHFHLLVYLDDCPHLYRYVHNVSVDVSFGLVRVFYADFWSLHGISKFIFVLNLITSLFWTCLISRKM